MTFLLYWGLAEHLIVEQIKEEIQAREGEVPTDEEIRNFIEETFSDEALQAHDPLTLSTLIINSLKRYSKGMG
ncbi:MAG: hypothetical protein LBO09_03835 [Candidatus Peribacteria bacterium]|nr:hypothetical protein [Candidatus Peribacteria bacterium]